MDLRDKHIVVTGGAGGIGRALVRRFLEEGARAVVVADRQLEGASKLAEELGAKALAVQFDAGRGESVQELIATATDAHGPIDIFVSNAGIGGAGGGPEAPDEAWDEAWRINGMAHVWASRALLPQMRERGEGYLLNTPSTACARTLRGRGRGRWAATTTTKASSLRAPARRGCARGCWKKGCRRQPP